jgi:5-methylcytosine-specific restriction endonuclease McrA
MPDRVPTFRPPWINRTKRPRAPDTARRSATALGYCSRAWRLTRAEVLLRDNYQCQMCGALVHGRNAHCDHVIAKRDGGSDEPSNVRVLCCSCHSRHEGWRAANKAMKSLGKNV